MTHQILLAGFGGQGILFSGKFLAYDGLIEEKEVISQQPFIRISDVSWGKISDIGFIPPSLQPQIQVEDKDYPYISSVPSTVALKVSSDGTTWSRAWEPPINGEIYIETKENDEDLDDA